MTLIFAILFSQTVQIPFLQKANASRAEYPNLVSILIPESINSGDLSSAVKRYAKDIQGSLAGSRAVIVELPDDITPEKIAAIEEKLYYEGDGEDSARLVGTVLIGNVPIPVVHKKDKTFLSVFPYVDFANKAFVYSADKGYYEASSDSSADDTPEIWHGIIAPNSGNTDTDKAKLVEYFDKSHDFYTKSGKYSSENTRSEPYVFYFDTYHDELSIKNEDWQAYKLGMQNIEDIIYDRYNKHFAKKLYDAYEAILSGGQVSLTDNADIKKILAEAASSSIDLTSAPDVQTQAIVDKIAKKFTDVLNAKYIGEILRYVYNAGRFGDATNVHVDISAALIAKRDDYAVKTMKDITTSLEKTIDLLARNGLSRNVAISTNYSINTATSSGSTSGSNGASSGEKKATNSTLSYSNYLMGRKADTITEAKDCTIVRGSTLRAEMNRGYNPNNAEGDTTLLNSDLGARCFPGSAPATQSYWGGNSPLNADFSKFPYTLKNHSYTGFSKSIFDNGGGTELDDSSSLGRLSPTKCFAIDLLADPYQSTDENGQTAGFPSETNGVRYSCITKHQTAEIKTFSDYLNGGFENESCTTYNLTLDGTSVATSGGPCNDSGGESGGGGAVSITKTYAYKKVSSVIEHKSPTLEEFGEQLKAMTSTSLPSDRDRYVSFISGKGNDSSIYYPNFFRIQLDENSLTRDKAKVKIKELLDKKSAEINALITSEQPAGKLWDLLKSGNYPNADVDLYAIAANNESALNSLADAVVWNNLTSPTTKYAYLLENFLDTDGNSAIPLPGHKSDYEVAYIGGKGDATALSLKVDPEAKTPLPDDLANLSSDMASFSQALTAMNAAQNLNSGSGEFKCSPPDGVDLWKWLPAVFCWISTLLPPTITGGSCSSSNLADLLKKETEEQAANYAKNGKSVYTDSDGNGIIDGMELVKDGHIGLTSDSPRVSHLASVTLTATLYDKSGNRILVDSGNDVSFEVEKIVDRSSGTAQTVYNKSGSGDIADQTTIRKYINIGSSTNAEAPAKVRAANGEAKFTFSTNSNDADITFAATVAPRDKTGKAAFVKISDPYTFEIRNEAINVAFFDANNAAISGSIHAGDYDAIRMDIAKTQSGVASPLSFPISLKVYDDTTDEQIGETTVITSASYTLKSALLQRAGSYKLAFSEKNGLTENVPLTILSSPVAKIDVVPASNMFVRGENDKVVVRALDKFGNLVSGDLVNLNMQLSGGGYFDENKGNSLTRSVVDGYTSFDVSSNNGGESITLAVSTSDNSLKQEIKLKSIDYAKVVVDVSDRGTIIAGKDAHKVTFRVADSGGNTLSDFQGYASLSFPAASGYFDTNIVHVVGGVSETGALLTPKTVAGKDLAITVSIPGVKDMEGNLVDVHNDVPMYASLSASNSQLEADPANSETITATLRDRYGNVASYGTEGASVDIAVADGYTKFAHLSSSGAVAFSGGIANTILNATAVPGTAYLTSKISPSIEGNTVSYTDDDGKTISLHGRDRNMMEVATYYLWNKAKLDKTDYNVLYTVLLGADYGNLTKSGYLAGELLFRSNSRALAVTSLLSPGLSRDSVVSITPALKVEISEDAYSEVSIGEELGHTAITVSDSYSNAAIAKAYVNLGSSTDFIACDADGSDGIDNCRVPTSSNSYAILKAASDTTVLSANGLSLMQSGAGKLVEVTPSGLIRAGANVKFELDEDNTKNLLALKITYSGKDIGYLAIKMNSDDIVIANSASEVTTALQANANSTVVQAISPDYVAESQYLGNSSFGKRGVRFILRSQTSETAADRDLVGNSEKTWYESYYETAGIGWEGSNKTLLDFAGGASVGEANKFYASYNTVNLGDPVVRLDRKGDTTYDRTIGSRLMQSSDDTIESYKSFDYNGDKLKDIVVFLSSGKIRLFENEGGGSFRDMGNLAYVADAGDSRKSVGNFEGDGYDDIAMVDKNGKLVTLINHLGKFERIDVTAKEADGTAMKLSGKITELSVFDMDQDGLDDIVIGDDSGTISVLYAGKENNSLVFTRKVVDSSLGLRLSSKATTSGSAVRYDGIGEVAQQSQADYANESANMDADASGLPESVAKALADSRIYYIATVTTEQTIPANASTIASALANGTIGNDPENPTGSDSSTTSAIKDTYSSIENAAGTGSLQETILAKKEEKLTFIRSEFSSAKWVEIEKTYTDKNGAPLQSDDAIQTILTVKNTSGKPLRNVRIMDTLESKVSRLEDKNYSLKIGSGSESKGTIQELDGESFDYLFAPFNLGVGQTATIGYTTKANTLSINRFVVGSLNSGDSYGDIAISSTNSCSASMTVWQGSSAETRSFAQTTQTFSGATLPKEITSLQTDTDGNGIPDSLEGVLGSGSTTAQMQSYAENAVTDYNKDTNSNTVPDRAETAGTLQNGTSFSTANMSIDIGGLGENADQINSMIDTVVAGLGCGFGGGSCMSLPLNWAPLAPGSSPSVFGFPLMGLSATTGIPVFAFPTTCPPYGYTWPACPIGAGGYLGPANRSQFRLFITPTITGAIGTAICFGPNYILGQLGIPKGVSPLVPGGNCIVAAKPLMSCKDDGSDGNINAIGYQSGYYGNNGAFINANSCTANTSSIPYTQAELQTLTQYIATGKNSVGAATVAGGKPLGGMGSGPLIGMGRNSGEDPNFEVSVDTKALKSFDIGNILKIKNTRISAFPDFLMDWANRQLEEVVNKLTSLPTLFIILPDFSKIFESGWMNFGSKLSNSYAGGTSSYQNQDFSVGKSETTGFKEAKSSTNAFLGQNKDTLNSGAKSISGLKAAYKFLSKLPAISFENRIVNMSIPIIAEEDIKKSIKNYKQWQTEINTKKTMWSKLGTKEWLDEKASLDISRTSSSINQNLKTLETYGEFPSKLQRYLTWKQRYASQIICNVEMIEKLMGGWISDNGKRFKTWVEFYILIKAILKSWQPLVDLFTDYKASCGTCKNERFDLKQFIFKIISAVIPKIPIVQFPKWPDIILDLHNVRLGLRIPMPEFAFTYTPIIIPHLPELHLPNTPSVGLSLPGIPNLPKIPELPNLPDLPSLPQVKLPDLPPPPKVPKLFAAISAVLKIFKIVAKILCIMRINPFVPEWRAGDQIAQITSRSGTFKLDFLNMEWPNFPISFIKAIRVTTFVNLEFQADFILEMARSTAEPINQFTANTVNIGAGMQPQNININGINNVQINVPGQEGQEIANPLKKNSFLMPSSETKTAMVGAFAYSVAKGFKMLLNEMDTESKQNLSLDEFKSSILSEVVELKKEKNPKVLAIADSLERAANYDGKSEDALTASLLADNTEKFSIVKNALRDEIRETEKLSAEFKKVYSGETPVGIDATTSNTIKIASLTVAKPLDEANKKLETYNKSAADALLALRDVKEDDELKTAGDALKSRVLALTEDAKTETFSEKTEREKSEYAASTTTTGDVSNSANALAQSSSSSYTYRGIYYFENGAQKRLFDYTEELDGTEDTAFVNRKAGENANSIIYRMDNGIYIKNPVKESPKGTNTSSADTLSASDVLAEHTSPSAPNYFTEDIVSPNEIQFSFAPANKDSEHKFRLEFYDYIEYFSLLSDGNNPDKLPAKSARNTVDLFSDDASLVTDGTKPGAIVAKTEAVFSRGSGDASGTIAEYKKFESGESLKISAGKRLYSYNGSARIKYRKDDSTEWTVVSLAKYENILFSEAVEVQVIDGSLVFAEDRYDTTTVDVNSLVGYPVMDKTSLTLLGENGFFDIRYNDDSTNRIDRQGTYTFKDLGTAKDSYSVTLERPNDYYYARLYAFGAGEWDLTKASLTLLSPQTAADDTGPIATGLSDTYKIPVYTKEIFQAKTYFTDISGISRIYADIDDTTDSNGDGIADNDADSDSGSFVSRGSNAQELVIGPFDAPGTHKVTLNVLDGNGNITKQSLSIVAYTPVPQITSTANSNVFGKLETTANGEPIDIMRVRAGRMERLTPSTPVVTDSQGTFSGSYATGSGLILMDGKGNWLARINETSGIIRPTSSGSTIGVTAASASRPLTLTLKDTAGNVVFAEQLSLAKSSAIQEATDISRVGSAGLYFIASSSDVSFNKNASNTSSLPGGAFISDTATKKAIVGIGSDGNMYLLDSTYSLSYREESGYISIVIKNASGKEVGRCIYAISAEYILR